MAKETLIKKIIANGCGCFKSGDEKILGEFEEGRLQEIVENSASHDATELVANAATTGFIDPLGNTHIFHEGKWRSKMVHKAPTGNQEEIRPAQTMDEYLSAAPPEIQRIVQNALKTERSEKEGLVTTLTANLTGEDKKRLTTNLLNEPIEKLRDLVKLLPVVRATSSAIPRFPSAIPAPVGNVKDDDDMLLTPKIDWATE